MHGLTKSEINEFIEKHDIQLFKGQYLYVGKKFLVKNPNCSNFRIVMEIMNDYKTEIVKAILSKTQILKEEAINQADKIINERK